MDSPSSRKIVITDQVHGLPFSKGLLASSLMGSGAPPADAFRVAELLEDELTRAGTTEITTEELRNHAAALLAREVGSEFSNTYLKWQAVEEFDQPLVVLVGGATGVGKSTLATRLAVRLGITRVMSTDAIREVLRSVLTEEMMPTLHTSSYEADRLLKVPGTRKANPLITGFQMQVQAVGVGVKSLISRAVREGTDIVVEGAHLVPGFLDDFEQTVTGAVVVPMVVRVSDGKLHKSHFVRRAAETRDRPTDKYLSHFDQIRTLQTYITQLAERHNVPVLEGFDIDSTLEEMVEIVLERALEHMPEWELETKRREKEAEAQLSAKPPSKTTRTTRQGARLSGGRFKRGTGS